MKRLFFCKTVCALMLVMLFAASAFADPWKFGIISDTQWYDSPDGKNPNSVAVNVINHINQKFIDGGVKFVVAVGDVTDDGSNLALDTRATFAQALYNAGIGFYPLRGNHESSNSAAIEFKRIFPQNQTGVNNQTPQNALVTTAYYGAPPANTNTTFTVGSNFASLSSDFAGLTYSFDYNNARFVLVDQFTPPSNASHNNLNSTDVTWVGSRLSGRPAGTHAFVFGHKHIISDNQVDTLFGSDPGATSTFSLQNSFMANLFNNGVRYYIGGHDHLYNRAIVTSPDGNSKVQDVITASDSAIFDTPAHPSNDYTYNDRSGAGPVAGNIYPREMEISQEVLTIGYHIVTVDGPKVTVEYYASPMGCDGCDLTNDIIPYTFTLRETFGYSLNGREFLVPQGQPYTSVQDSYSTTTARILSGTNGSTETAGDGRQMTKTVDTGWAPGTTATASDILTLWGMTDISADHTDTFALSMTYNPTGVTDAQIQSGSFGLKVQDAGGVWIDAVDLNVGGSKQFVMGAWNSGYTLGAYGVDSVAHTAWAVVNYNSAFAVAPDASGLTPPVTTANASGYAFGSWTSSTTVAVTLSASGGSGGIAAGYPKYCTDSTNTCTPNTSYVSAINVTCVSGSTCTRYIRYRSQDNAGIIEAVKSALVLQDIQAPATTAAATGYTFGNWTGSGTVSVALSASDGSGSGVGASYPRYCVDNTNNCTPSLSYSTAFNVTCAPGSACTQYVRYRSTDNTGNSEAVQSVAVKQDPVTPTTTAAATGYTFGSWTGSGTVSVALSASDGSGSGVGAGYPRYCVDNTNTCTPNLVYSTAFNVICAPGSVCTQNVRYRSQDNVGNLETIQIALVKQDFQAPTTTPSVNGGPYHSIPNVTLGCSDGGGSGCSSTNYCLGSGCTPLTPYAGQITISSSNTLRYSSTDVLGNIEAVGSQTYTLDTAPPSLTLSALADGSYTNNATMNIAGTAGDINGIQSVAINGQVAALNTTDNINYTFSYPMTLAAGANIITTVATDKAGNTATDTRTITLDKTLPVLTLAAPADSSVVSNPAIAVTGTTNEPATVLISLNSGPTVTAAVAATSFSLPLSLPTNTVNTINVYATDLAGNTTTVKRTVTTDETNPTLAVTVPNQDMGTNQTHITVSGTVGDLTNLTILASCSSASVGVVNTPNATTWSVNVTNLQSGVNSITIRATDQAGNSTTVTRNIVNTATPISIIAVTSPTNVNSQTIGGTRELNAAVAVNCPTATAGTVTYPSATTWQSELTLISQGTNTITVAATDLVGNTSSPVSAVIVLDTSAPVTTASPPGGLYNAARTVTLTANKPGTIYFTTDGTMPTTGSAVYSVPLAVASSTVLKYFARDLAGNDETVKTQTYTIETTPPLLTLSTLANGSYTNNATLNITGTAGDINGIQSVVVNGQAAALNAIDTMNYTFSYPMTLVTGPNVITTVATDKAGNTTADSRTIILDQSAPVLTMTSPADNTFTKTASLTVTGTLDAAATVLISLASGPSITAVQGGTSFSLPVSLAYGQNTITIVATDLAGNTTTARRTATYDAINPALAITNPSQDLSTNQASMTLSGTVSDLTNVALLISCPTASVGIVTNPAAATWQVAIMSMTQGVNVITVTATDQAGNSTVATRSIIYDITPPTITVKPVATPTGANSQIISGIREQNAAVAVNCPTATVGTVIYPSATTWQSDLTLMSEGTNTVTITATDAVGNTSSPLNVAIVFDHYIAINGDIDGDGIVDSTDALKALRMAVGLYTPTAAELSRGDVAPLVSWRPHPDGKMDINDVAVILRRAAGLVSW